MSDATTTDDTDAKKAETKADKPEPKTLVPAPSVMDVVLAPKKAAPWAPETPAGPVITSAYSPLAAHTPQPKPAGPVQTDYYKSLKSAESGNNPFANSGVAKGLYQFTPQTWNGVAASHPELGLRPEDIMNPEKQEMAIRAFTADNAKILTNHKLEPTPANLRMMHFLGAGAGPKFLDAVRSTPEASAVSLFPKEAQYNHNVFFNKDGSPRTVAQVYSLQTKNFGGTQVDMSMPAQQAQQAQQEAAIDPDILSQLPEGAKLEAVSPAKAPAQAIDPDILAQLPEGATLDPVKAGLESADKFKGSGAPLGAAAADVSKLGVPAQAPTPEPSFAGEIPADSPEEYAARVKREGEFYIETAKGVGAGVGEVGTGLAEMLPNDMGGAKAAEATRYLQTVGNPLGRAIGQTLPWLMGAGEIAGAEELGLGAKTLLGMGEGGLAGASEATGKESGTERAAEKAEAAGIGAGLGAIPGVGEVAWSGLKGAGNKLNAFLGGAKSASETARSTILTESEKAIAAAEKTAAEKGAEISKGEKALAAHNEELGRIEKAQQQIAERDQVRETGAIIGRDPMTGKPIYGPRSTAQAPDLAKVAETRAAVSERMRDSVRDAERHAEAAGLAKKDAADFAVSEQQKIVDADEAAQKLKAEHAANPTMSSEELGDKVQNAANEIYEKHANIRRKNAGFKEAIEKSGSAPNVNTSSALAYINRILPDQGNNTTIAILRSIAEKLKTATKVAEGAEPEFVEGVNLAKADSIRKDVSSAVRSKMMAMEGANPAPVPAEAAHHLGEVYKRLLKSIGDESKPYMEAMQRYRELSRPLDVFERKGALKSVIADDSLSGDFAMGKSAVVVKLLNSAKQGQPAIQRLVSENPELKDSLRMYFSRELFGFDTAAAPSVGKMETFLKNNENALHQSGLWDEFSSMKRARESAEQAVSRAKENAKIAASAEKEASSAEKQALAEVEKTRKLSAEARAREEAIAPREQDKLAAKQEKVEKPSDVAAAEKAKAAEEKLAAQKKEATGKAKETESSIGKMATEKAKAEKTAREFGTFKTVIENPKLTTSRQVSTEGLKFAERMRNSDLITEEQFKTMTDKLGELEKLNMDADQARKYALWAIQIGLGGVSATWLYRVTNPSGH